MKFEILAPAGSRESLVAGVRCGADAVYLGGKTLNARRSAGNFNDEELKKAIQYCHSHAVKVYITLNTLCRDGEFSDAFHFAEKVLTYGADAFIVQDIGIVKMLGSCFPGVRIHASTQMSAMTPSAAAFLKKAGVSRLVLPREMTADEIGELAADTDLELEMFVHGALCMSVSGQCYFSAMIGQRSGNRGLCAQPCRLPFSACKEGGFDLSLKDLSLLNQLEKISGLGVLSLKIEGRMKRPEYVAAAVSSIKKAINGAYSFKDEELLKNVFSRSGFTEGYFNGTRDRSMFGTRQKEDVVSARQAVKYFSHLYDNENPLVPIDMELEFLRSKPVRLTAEALGKKVSVICSEPQQAINRAETPESLKNRLSKLGGTQFYVSSIKIKSDDGLMLPAAEINALRRKAVEALSAAELKMPLCYPPDEIPPRERKETTPYFTARFADIAQIPKDHPFKRIFIPVWSSDEAFLKTGAGAELPRGLFGVEKRLEKRLRELKKRGVKNALCGNIGAYQLAEKIGFHVYGDFGLNVFNSLSARNFNSPILSFELTVKEANSINAEDTGMIAYGRLPLMLTRICPVKSRIGCDKCGKNGTLTDRRGVSFPIVCSPYPCVQLLNSVPLYMGDKMKDIKTDFIHFYFTDESKSDVKKIIALYKNGEKADFDYTRGLYYRGVF